MSLNYFEEKNADFALELLRKTINLDPSAPKMENIVFSPTLIALAIGLVHQGAHGATRDQISKHLFGKLTEIEIIQNLTYLSRSLNHQTTEGVTLKLANQLFVDDNFKISDQFSQEILNIFQATPENLPFAADSQKSIDRINQFVKEKTSGLIDKLINHLSSCTKLVIANAIYFKVNIYVYMGFKK